MTNYSRNLLVLFNQSRISEKEADYLREILMAVESAELFCTAHELVDRNRIISKKEKIIKESRRLRLRPFRFLINRN